MISLHERTFHDVVIPSLPSGLWGSFNQRRLPSPRVSAVVGAEQSSPAASSVSRTLQQAGILDTNVSLSTSLTGEGIPLDHITESLRRAGGVKKEDGTCIRPTNHVLVPPDIRYRVRLEGTSLMRKSDGVSGVGAPSNQVGTHETLRNFIYSTVCMPLFRGLGSLQVFYLYLKVLLGKFVVL